MISIAQLIGDDRVKVDEESQLVYCGRRRIPQA